MLCAAGRCVQEWKRGLTKHTYLHHHRLLDIVLRGSLALQKAVKAILLAVYPSSLALIMGNCEKSSMLSLSSTRNTEGSMHQSLESDMFGGDEFEFDEAADKDTGKSAMKLVIPETHRVVVSECVSFLKIDQLRTCLGWITFTYHWYHVRECNVDMYWEKKETYKNRYWTFWGNVCVWVFNENLRHACYGHVVIRILTFIVFRKVSLSIFASSTLPLLPRSLPGGVLLHFQSLSH